VIGWVVGVLAGLAAISTFLFDHGRQSINDVLGWMSEWSLASDSASWMLWCGLALVLRGLLRSAVLGARLTTTKGTPRESFREVLLLAWAMVGLEGLPLLAILFSLWSCLPRAWRVLSLLGCSEISLAFLAAVLIGGIVGAKSRSFTP
jgi:hypothetical protein